MKKIFCWKVIRWVLFGTLLLFAGVQLVPIDRSNPPVESEIPAPENVRSILRRACYDCHSNETVWPWYSKIAPISWLIAHDVHEGREELNFSTWNQITTQQQIKKMKESWEEIAEREMPPWFYLKIHRNAILSIEDRTILRNWALKTPIGSDEKNNP